MKQIYTFLFLGLLFACSPKNEQAVQPASPSIKLKSVTHMLPDQQGVFRPAEKIVYSYSDGKLIKQDQLQYDVTVSDYFLFSTTHYSYVENRLIAIVTVLAGSGQTSITSYQYSGNTISKVFRDDVVDTEALYQYQPGNKVEVRYNQSNGRWFIYKFTLTGKNIGFEQTINDSQQLSSEVTHEFDNSKNPYALLGYTDMFFTNYSANNRVKTTSQFFGASMPQSVPVAYEYQLNGDQYPLEQITTYQSLGNQGQTGKSKTVFEYE